MQVSVFMLFTTSFSDTVYLLKYISENSMNFGRIDSEALKSYITHWPPQRWQEYEPLLTYCRDNGIRLIACGVPLEVLAECIQVLNCLLLYYVKLH